MADVSVIKSSYTGSRRAQGIIRLLLGWKGLRLAVLVLEKHSCCL